MTKTATFNPDKQSITLTGRQWSNTYRRMRDEHPKAGDNYDGWIEALERLKAGIGRG